MRDTSVNGDLTPREFMYERQEKTGGDVELIMQDIVGELYDYIKYNVFPVGHKPVVYKVAFDAIEAIICGFPEEIIWSNTNNPETATEYATAEEAIDDLKLEWFVEDYYA